MSGCELRAHHALCIGFFRGRGYSPAFVENMVALVGALRSSDPFLTLQSAPDGLCRHCPHNRGGICESVGRVSRYDAAVLRLLGLEDGATLPRSALAALVRQRITEAGRLGEVCPDCQWHAICAATEYQL